MASRWISIAQALVVTFLWSTSFVLVKWGLEDIPPLTFAGLRYTLAFFCLLPLVLQPARRATLKNLSRTEWRDLILLGLLVYTLTQGANFLSLSYLPAATVSLLLNLTTVIIVLLGIKMLSEYPTSLQYGGMGLFLVGLAIYFYPANIPGQQVTGLLIATFQLFSNAAGSILGRHINRQGHIPALIVTLVSMGMGAIILLIAGIVTQGLPRLSLTSLLIITWLAVVNTAFAFSLWNHTQRSLTVMESSIINNTMLIQIGLLAWLFLDEDLSTRAVIGMCLAAVGILLVQLRSIRWLARKPAFE